MRKWAMRLARDTGVEAAGEEAHAGEQARETEQAHAVSEVPEETVPAQEQAQPEQERAESEAAEQAQDARELALAAREKEIERRELRAQALERLAAQHLPAVLAEMLDYTDAQAMDASLEAIRETWSQAVQKGIEERMKGAAPRTGGASVRPGTLREAIEGRYAGA